MPSKNDAIIDKSKELALILEARARMIEADQSTPNIAHASAMRAASAMISTMASMITIHDERLFNAAEKLAEVEGVAASARKSLLSLT